MTKQAHVSWLALGLCRLLCLLVHAHHPVEEWVSCVTEVLQPNAATVRHQLNVYGLNRAAEGTFQRDLLDQLLPALSANGSQFSVNLAPYPRTVSYNQRNFVLILLQDVRDFLAHLPALVRKNVELRGYFLLLLVPGAIAVEPVLMGSLMRRLWSVRIHNVLLAIGLGAHRIDLHGYDPYGPGCCDCSRPVRLDRCHGGVLERGHRSMPLYDRFPRNLYGCRLRIACFERAPFMQFVNTTTSRRLTGIEGSLVELMADRLNFRVSVVQPMDGRVWGRIYPNGTADGAMGLLMDGAVHLTLGGYFPYPKLLTNTTQSHNYYTTDLVLAVPEALATFSPLEQLLKPFQLTIWVLVAVELVVGFVTLRPAAVVFNFWRTFVGESVANGGPRRATARFVLLLWILHSTLLRECYKGSLVGYLTEPNPLNDIHSLAVLLASGYRLAMTENVYHKVFDGAPHHHQLSDRSQLLLIEPADGLALLERTIRTRDRLALAYTREEIIKFNERNRTVLNYRTSDEQLLTFHFAMYFKRSSPMAAVFDWYIRRVVATGFVVRWHRIHLDMRFQRPTLAATGQAEVLHVRHLLGSYLLLLGGLSLATLAFTCEVAWVRWWWPRPVSTGHHYPYLHELRQCYPPKRPLPPHTSIIRQGRLLPCRV
uniref:Putative ionotropic receptor ligand binding domain-containing protein n=1 Tax=Anopheles farauti TaxID=69004 RepID=A0A182QWW5_9DIPT